MGYYWNRLSQLCVCFLSSHSKIILMQWQYTTVCFIYWTLFSICWISTSTQSIYCECFIILSIILNGYSERWKFFSDTEFFILTTFPTWKILSDNKFLILHILNLENFLWHQISSTVFSDLKNFLRHQMFHITFPTRKIFSDTNFEHRFFELENILLHEPFKTTNLLKG